MSRSNPETSILSSGQVLRKRKSAWELKSSVDAAGAISPGTLEGIGVLCRIRRLLEEELVPVLTELRPNLDHIREGRRPNEEDRSP